ncbi:caspase family protein [Microcoleus sp. F8_C2]
MAWEYDKTNFDRNLAVVIGIDRYKNDSIHDLSTPVSDARAFADLLETEYGYNKDKKGDRLLDENVVCLFDEAATLTGLQTLLDKTLPNQLKPTKGDRLIFYFAGHGIPRNSQDGPEGYLVPQDADWQKDSSFLAMSEVYKALSKLECHHLLVILDCCFAGTFRWAGRRKMIPILETVRKEHYDRFIRYPAWQVITSAAHDQEALDVAKLAQDKRGAVADENQELHSPFALALLEGLRENKADVIPDGVITAHELYLYLDQQVSKLSGDRQKPGIYPMRLEYDRGEFVFTRPGFTSSQLKPAPLLNESNNPYRGLASFDEKHANFFFGRKILVEELQHRLSQANRSLTVVLGASGSGKSSLVKAGLIPELRQQSKWYILDPIRPDRSPFTALARAILPIAQPELIEQLSQVSFLDEVFKPKEESGQDKGDESTDAVFVKLAESWNSATSEAKLLIVEDYFEQLLAFSHNLQEQEKKQLSQLYRAIFEQLESLSNRLQNEPQHLTRVIRKWSETHLDIKLLLTIDQFEELITMSQESQTETHGGDRQKSDSRNETAGDRAAESQPWLPFLQVLREAIAECPQQLHIVLTLRSDFEPRFLSSPLLAYWTDARFPVRALNLDELRQAIEGPALKQALYFEPPELVGKLIDEVGQMPGALPLLSFTLSELYIKLYERWTKDNATDRALRIKDYEELGGVAGALTRRATEEYDNLVRELGEESGKAYQATMRRVMLRMVAIEGGGAARRRVPESELVYPDSEENKRVAQVTTRLVKARLLVKGQETGEPYVEPAHDFLVRGWDKLQQWIKNEQGNIALHRELTPTVNKWASSKQEKQSGGLLWDDDPRLPLAKQLYERNTNWLNFSESDFIQCSIKQRRNKRNRAIGITSTVIAMLISFTVYVFIQLQLSLVREKAARSLNLLTSDKPIDGLLLAIQTTAQNHSMLRQVDVSSQSSLLSALQVAREKNILVGHEGIVYAVAMSADQRTIVSGGSDGTVRLWDSQGQPIGEPLRGHQSAVYTVAMSDDGQTIVSGSLDGTIRLWNRQGQSLIKPIRVSRSDNQRRVYGVYSVSISPDGKTIVGGGDDGIVQLWNRDGKPLWNSARTHGNLAVYSVVISRDGKTIVSGSADGTVQLWSHNGKALWSQPVEVATLGVYSVAISRDGQTILASHAFTGAMTRLSRDGNKGDEPPLLIHERSIFSTAVTGDGETIVTGSADGTVGIRTDSTSKLLRGHEKETWVLSVAVSVDGKTVVSGGADGTVRIWDLQELATNKPIRDEYSVESNPIFALSANGQTIANVVDSKELQLLNRDGTLKWKSNQKKEIIQLAISADGQTTVSGDSNGVIQLWDSKGTPQWQPTPRHQDSRAIAISADGQTIATGGGTTVQLWDRQGKGIWQAPQKHESFITSLAINSDGQTIVSGTIQGVLRVWNKQGQLLLAFQGTQRTIESVALSSDGKLIVSGDDRSIQLWNQQGQPIGPLLPVDNPHVAYPQKLVFDLDDQTLKVFNAMNEIYGSIKINWSSWLHISCNRLLLHPRFRKLSSEVDRQAWQACYEKAWSPEEAAHSLLEQGRTLAKSQQLQRSREKFNEAIALNPSLNIKPDNELHKLAAAGLTEEGEKFAKEGKIEESLRAFAEAQIVDPSIKISAYSGKILCWYGSLHQQADKVIEACNHAVKLAPEDGSILDSRGLARAMTGNTTGAIEDFQAFINWSIDNDQKTLRQQWINTLRKGNSPFTPEQIENLKSVSTYTLKFPLGGR